MPRGADYDDGIPRSDNAIEPGRNITNGAGEQARQSLLITTSSRTFQRTYRLLLNLPKLIC
jgi:hypothetical protein